MNLISYIRVSTDQQADSGLGLEAQEAAIRAACTARGFTVADTAVDAGFSAKNLRRPALQRALADLRAKKFDGLIVAKLDRISRSIVDFGSLMERAKREGWKLICLDIGMETGTPSGELMANIIVTFAQYERRLISERTKNAMAAAKARGMKFGSERAVAQSTVDAITTHRNSGCSWRDIARTLNECAIASPTGRQWYPASARRVWVRFGQQEVAA